MKRTVTVQADGAACIGEKPYGEVLLIENCTSAVPHIITPFAVTSRPVTPRLWSGFLVWVL